MHGYALADKRRKLTYNKNMNIRKLPVGIQSFESLRTGGYLYVDKTRFIYELVHSGKTYFLSRPRRFGKSILVSTLRAYFEGKKELFAGLAIDKLEAVHNGKWQEYPVLCFDFAGGDYQQQETLSQVLDRCLRTAEELFGRDTSAVSLADRFYALVKRAREQTGLGAVILVDEYDKPLLDTLNNPALNEKNRNILKGFFWVLKTVDQWTRFSLLTGVTKFSQVSVFSDLNQLCDISMFARYEAICGITQTELEQTFQMEIQELAQVLGTDYVQTLNKLREMYDGYHFCEENVHSPDGIYNPFSLLNAFYGLKLQNYWIQSGTSQFLVDILQKSQIDLRCLLNGIQVGVDSFMEYRLDTDNPVPVIYQSGYFTIRDYDTETGLYTLGFPNDEVAAGFLFLIAPYYTGIPEIQKEFYIARFVQDLRNGDVDSFMTRMQAIYATLPTHRNTARDTERDFQTAFLIIFELMGLSVIVEKQLPAGRCDAVVTTAKYVYVIEFKLSRGAQTETAEAALAQINEKGYAAPYLAGSRKVIKIGAQFNARTGALERWIAEQG